MMKGPKMSRKSDDAFDKVMKGVKNPKKDNPYHKDRLKKDAKKAKDVDKAQRERKAKHTRRKDDGGSFDTGMFSS
jgi:DNA-nicking Smr family endonuclease